VPKFTVIVGGSFGAGNYAMCGPPIPPASCDVAHARISVMGGEQAANVLSRVRRDALEARGESWPLTKKKHSSAIREQYERQEVLYSSARLGMMRDQPHRHRRVLGLCLSASASAPMEETRFGLFRM